MSQVLTARPNRESRSVFMESLMADTYVTQHPYHPPAFPHRLDIGLHRLGAQGSELLGKSISNYSQTEGVL